MELQGPLSNLWKRAEELFLAAADLPETEQRQFLERECRGDEALRAEVESLLAYDRRGEPPIADAIEQLATSLLAPDPYIGERFGAYRVLREVGRGGMATVYLAVRDDDQYRKSVAVKLVKSGISTSHLLDSFRYERQILANLDHPYIARLLDGGTTDNGLPYFVMEYIEGVPIDSYCEEHKLSVEQRCELFCKVCEAVSYAHRNLVIHRDLKPGNLLVTADGVPKLLDFGIAKLLTPDGSNTAYSTGLTMAWALTPDYASPEQVRGEPVTTATDVYSLGALLYRMLSGAKPHSITNYTPSEVERVVCGEEPLRPSDVATGTCRRRLEGDLDNIVLMAMRKEPDRRYRSVDELSKDVWHHLQGLPVAAREDTLGYRAGKFLKRHRIATAATTAAVFSLAMGTTWALWESQRASEALRVAERERQLAEAQTREAERNQVLAGVERDRARKAGTLAESKAQEAVRARALAERRLRGLLELSNRSILDIQGAIQRLPGATEARRQIAKTTMEFLDGLAREAEADPRVQLLLAQAYLRLGDVHGLPYESSLGNTAEALASYRKSYAILRRFALRKPHDFDLEMQTAVLDYRIGIVLLGTSSSGEAIKSFEHGLSLARAWSRARPDDSKVLGQVGLLQQALTKAWLRVDQSRAVLSAREQLDTYRKLVSLRPSDDGSAHGLSAAYTMSATVMSFAGQLQEAVDYVRKSIEIREKLSQRHPHDSDLQRDLMLSYGHMGDRLGSPLTQNLGQTEAAKLYYRKARTIAEAMVAADASNRMARRDLGTVLMRLGVITGKPDEREESLAYLRQSAGILEEQLKTEPRNSALLTDLAIAYDYTGQRLFEAGAYPNAIASYRKALDLSERQTSLDPASATPRIHIMSAYKGLALARAKQNDRDGALRQIRIAVEAAEHLARDGPNPRAMQRFPALVQSWLGSVYEFLAQAATVPNRQFDDWKQARDAYARSRALWTKVEPGYQAWSRAEISFVEQHLQECERHIRPASGNPQDR